VRVIRDGWRVQSIALVVAAISALSCRDSAPPTGVVEVEGEGFDASGYHLPKAEKQLVNGREVVVIGFENDSIADDASFTISPFVAVEGATFGSDTPDSLWISCPGNDVASPTCAAFENAPSPTRGARSSGFGYDAVLTFDPPVSSVSFRYTAYITNDHTLNAFNASGQLIASSFAPGTDETSDEEPYLNTWGTVSVDVESDLIRKVVYSGVGVPWLDDLTFSRKARCSDIFAEPTGDPILDRPEVQEALYDALVEGGAFSPDIEARLEEGGWIFERPDGTTYARRTEDPLAQTACGMVPGGAFPLDPEDTPIAGYHTHPFSDGDILPSGSCDLNEPHTYDAFRHGGPSYEDWEDLIKESGIPHFVIDLDNVYAVQQYVPESERANTPSHQWTDSTCTN